MKTPWKAALVTACFAAWVAHATTVLSLDLPALTKSSDAIVHGKVSRTEARMSKDGRRIWTHVTVDVSESLKGSGARSVEIVQPGGIVGDIGQRVAGTATLRQGDEVVTFLERRGGDTYLLTGMAQGCYHVERSTDGKAAFAVPDGEAGATLVDPVTHAEVAKNSAPMKLDELKSKIRSMLPAQVIEPGPVTAPGKTTAQ